MSVSDFWQRRSLRFWLATGMVLAIAPLLFSAAFSGFIVYRHVLSPLVDVSAENRYLLRPLQKLQMDLWDISTLVTDDVTLSAPRNPDIYLFKVKEINRAFQGVAMAVSDRSSEAQMVDKAREFWGHAAKVSQSMLTVGNPELDSFMGEKLDEFDGDVDRAVHFLDVVFENALDRNQASHDEALRSVARSKWLVIGAFSVSGVFIVLGIYVINRSLVSSMKQLVDGALRLSAGDGEHRIDVRVPSEMAHVASAFNSMTKKIIDQQNASERAARTDGLTGLYNRREFDRILREEIQRGERSGGSVGLLMIDIDHFKQFNDTYGHQGGDSALIGVANTLEGSIRGVDKACRFGGEELAVVLPDSSVNTASQTAERIRETLSDLVISVPGGKHATVTVSVGVAAYPDNGRTAEDLLKAADKALYVSKEQGRNRVTIA